ncbi:membrane protein insertase YidC [Geodermatophilus sp. YIM 151500]|uniref:membrane protein insertase YidC n=1 Tax=Geodermatophilus sp. YIM 151500 TaxID=2984531 RepID=UPI0021E4D363|nr:membrane protein insertase YidC [Geodermatophilus sp. YIM 151500]MCV2491259.1 membrane protein insertase YidC [Geodermatophilus sp. YIM 151500]
MLDWLYTAIAWVMKQWHTLFSTFLDPAGGITWALSIAFLVVTVRLILFPLFVKQVKSQRAMQEIAPELQKLRQQYGADRQGYSQAVMALQRERGVNPLAGCLPILPQIPIFLALFHVLRRLAPGKEGLYSWSTELTQQASVAELFGAPISASFDMTGAKEDAILALPGVGYTEIRVVAFVLIVTMCFTTFFTQKQIMRRSGPVEGQAAMVQKFLLYGMPLSLFVTGFFFPIGVLLYWMTNNLWTMGQQFFILRKMPPPGSAAAKAKAEAGKPVVDPKTLAPKPGAKPVRPKAGRPQPPAAASGDTAAAGDTAASGDTAAAGDEAPSETPSPADAASAGGSSDGRPDGKAAGTPARRSPQGRPRAAAGRGGQAPANRGKRKRR